MLISVILAAGILAGTTDISLPTKNELSQELIGDGDKVWTHMGERIYWNGGKNRLKNCKQSIRFIRDGTCERQTCQNGMPKKTWGKWTIGEKRGLDWTLLIDGKPYLVQARKDDQREYLIISTPAPAGGKNVDEFYQYESR